MNLFLTSTKGLGLAITLILATPQWAHAQEAKNIDELAEQIRKTDEQLDALKKSILQNKQLKQDLQTAFETAREKRGERDERLSTLDTRINAFNTRLNELDVTVNKASSNIEQRKQQLAVALRSSQNIGDNTGLRALLQHDDPAHAQRLQLYREYLFNAQKQHVDSAIAYLEGVEAARVEALKDRNWLNHIRDKANSQRKSFARDAQTARQQIDSVDVELLQTSRTVAQLEQDQERLQQLMEELETSKRGGSGYFTALKGQYRLPVNGQITARFGDRKSVGRLLWQGLFIEADDGTAVQAVADGEVVYSDWLQGFGMLVIVDHGDGYMTLYGGNRTVNASAGSWVESGSTIATVGNSGGQSTSGLYFEIRHNASALDPEQWLNMASN